MSVLFGLQSTTLCSVKVWTELLFLKIIFCIFRVPVPQLTFQLFYYWKTTKYFLVSVKHNNVLFYFILMMTCFCHLTIIRLSLQNLEQGTWCENNIHVIWDPIRLTNVLKYRLIQKDVHNWRVNGASTHASQLVTVFQVLCSLYGLTCVGYA